MKKNIICIKKFVLQNYKFVSKKELYKVYINLPYIV